MLNGNFANCYGLKQFQLSNINFSQCNKAIIYAPNGVMKSSLSQVFDDISKGKPTKDRNITTDEKKKLLFSSIPFYRNLCEYSGKEDAYLKLTSFLHLKTNPIDTVAVNISELWNIINPFLDNATFTGTDEPYYDALIRIANSCVADTTNEVLLDNKLVIAIAIRLKTEKFLQQTLIANGQTCVDATSNQTREWFLQALPFLTDEQKDVVEEVNLITPESIHLNSFMFEPLIDISDWSLKELYRKVSAL